MAITTPCGIQRRSAHRLNRNTMAWTGRGPNERAAIIAPPVKTNGENQWYFSICSQSKSSKLKVPRVSPHNGQGNDNHRRTKHSNPMPNVETATYVATHTSVTEHLRRLAKNRLSIFSPKQPKSQLASRSSLGIIPKNPRPDDRVRLTSRISFQLDWQTGVATRY